MTTRRARKHKGLVEFEKKYHHLAGRKFIYRHSKTRWSNLTDAVQAESAYEWHNQKQYSELAEELAELGPVSLDPSEKCAKSEFVRELLEALKDD